MMDLSDGQPERCLSSLRRWQRRHERVPHRLKVQMTLRLQRGHHAVLEVRWLACGIDERVDGHGDIVAAPIRLVLRISQAGGVRCHVVAIEYGPVVWRGGEKGGDEKTRLHRACIE